VKLIGLPKWKAGIAAASAAVVVSLCASSFLYASHVKSEPSEKSSDCAAEITKHGHEVGNHTWSHLDLTQQPDDVVRDEILRAERATVQASGQSPRPRWRAPYGARDKRVLKIAATLGYRSIYWTLDSQDGTTEDSPVPHRSDHQ
jgi:peptidoglycan/xylan/chitin deacetylase (PgdA/CDA1 family)